jgi:hypothetical protein
MCDDQPLSRNVGESAQWVQYDGLSKCRDMRSGRFCKVRNVFATPFLISWGGVGLSSLGTLATNWPSVPALGDR